jgi:hypothetical protein
VSVYSFLDPKASYALPRSFRYHDYIDTERELWALFPETEGRRVNFCQAGLTAQVYVESPGDRMDLGEGETYFLMPCADLRMRPVRMRPLRRLTLEEFRMSQFTAIRLSELLAPAQRIMEEVHFRIMGPEIVRETERL